jgi:cephalosporin hydroxylase
MILIFIVLLLSIVSISLIIIFIKNNNEKYINRPLDTKLIDLKYSKSHGMNKDNTIPIIESFIKFTKPDICVCIGTGDGLIPRVLRQSQISSGKINGKTILIDLGETMGAMPDKIHNLNSKFRKIYPDIDVFKGFSVPNGINYLKNNNIHNIDILWIDGDHSFEGSLNDFKNYSKLLSNNGFIFMHDTLPNGKNNKQPDWCGVNKTIQYIHENYKNEFELINIVGNKNREPGAGFAIIKRKQ